MSNSEYLRKTAVTLGYTGGGMSDSGYLEYIAANIGSSGGGGTGGGTTAAEKAKLAMIAGTTPINFDEVLLDGDIASNADLVAPSPTPEVLARVVSNAGFRSATGVLQTKTMMEKGTITDVKTITETGIYEGVDVANSPVTGSIMVMANKDSNGDFGFFLMGQDGALHTGGKPAGHDVFWTKIKSVAVADGAITVDASYSGVFVSPDMDSFTGSATTDLYDGDPHKVVFIDKAGNDWTTRKDPYAWYLKSGGELGHFKGASGHIGSKIMEGWVSHKNIVTIQYTNSTTKEFNVLKVEGDAQVGGSNHITSDGSVKLTDHLVIGDRSGVAELTLDSKTGNASHVVFKREGVPKSSIGVIASNNDELIIEQRANEDIRFILPAGQNIVAKIGGKFHTIATIESIREFASIVDAPIANHAKPTLAEAKAAFKMLPHYDWTKNDHFEIKDTSGGKIVKITYRGEAGATEANSGDFSFKILTKIV